MVRDLVDFRVTRLEARVPDGIPIAWRGRHISSGPLAFDLDDALPASGGTMDYGRGIVSVEFRVRLRPALGAILQLASRTQETVRVVLRAQGDILPDHSFAGGLRGSCTVEPNCAFAPEDIRIEVLPGF
jgi:hypothetical protein